MMRRLLIILFFTGCAHAAENRVALVIGNAKYPSAPLINPVNDARAMSSKLSAFGFKTILRENLTQKQIGATLREFRAKLSPGTEAVFFYAGHGMQIKGVNYLPAVDAEIASEEDVPTQSIDVNKVLEIMEESKTRLNLVFLDACRNNPYTRRFRSQQDGLAKITAPSGTILSFATRPGSVAADGEGSNGLYTEHLLKAISEEGLSIEQTLKKVLVSVKNASRGKQEPWSEGGIEGEFYFIPAAKTKSQALTSPMPPLRVDPMAVELSFWESIKNSQDPSDFEEYLRQYPQGRFSGLARNRLKPAQMTSPSASVTKNNQRIPDISDDVSLAASLVGRWEGEWQSRRIEGKLTLSIVTTENTRLSGKSRWLATAYGDIEHDFMIARVKNGKLLIDHNNKLSIAADIAPDRKTLTGTWVNRQGRGGNLRLKKAD